MSPHTFQTPLSESIPKNSFSADLATVLVLQNRENPHLGMVTLPEPGILVLEVGIYFPEGISSCKVSGFRILLTRSVFALPGYQTRFSWG